MKSCPHNHCRKPSAFTLLELLVVIAIIGILAALAVPAYNRFQIGIKRTECVSRLRSLGMAMNAYAADNGGRLPGFGKSSDSRWLHQVAPYLGYAPNETVDGIPVAKGAYAFEVFSCPSRDTWMAPKVSGNAGIYGINPNLIGKEESPNSSSGPMHGVALAAIPRPAATVLLADKTDGAPAMVTTKPFPEHPRGIAANHRPDRRPANGRDGDRNQLYVDGHVKTLSKPSEDDIFEIE
jgi:prepilin-type N-terminal cleavage/methylation domain-containing protein/prepilin-type processing-associated H-X9-DG protein